MRRYALLGLLVAVPTAILVFLRAVPQLDREFFNARRTSSCAAARTPHGQAELAWQAAETCREIDSIEPSPVPA